MAPLTLPLFPPVMWSTLPPPQVQQAACAEKPFFHKSSKPLGCEETPASMWISHGLDWCNQWFRCPTTNSAWILSTNRISCLSSYALSRCFAVHQALHVRCEQSSPPKTSKKNLNGKELMPFAERDSSFHKENKPSFCTETKGLLGCPRCPLWHHTTSVNSCKCIVNFISISWRSFECQASPSLGFHPGPGRPSEVHKLLLSYLVRHICRATFDFKQLKHVDSHPGKIKFMEHFQARIRKTWSSSSFRDEISSRDITSYLLSIDYCIVYVIFQACV